MLTSQAPADAVQTADAATESTGHGKGKGALWSAIGAFLLLVVLILTNMK